MAPAPPLVVATSQQAWNLIQQDFTLRLSLVAHQWAEQLQKQIGEIHYETRRRGNAAHFNHARIQLEIEHTNMRAEWEYQACCEIWEIQGRQKCRAFFRAVFDWCLTPLFATRQSCLQGEFNHRAMITGNPSGNSAAVGAFARELGRLKAEWNTKLEIATRDNEYRQRLAREREAQAKTAIAAPILPGPSTISASKPRVKHREKALTVHEKLRRKVIFGAIQMGLKGKDYCSELDCRRLALPLAWKAQGCPDTYTLANKDAHWRQKIQDEKSRFRDRFEVTAPRERKEIIEGNAGTRRTRQ